MHLYYIATSQGVPFENTWATDVGAAWQNFCDRKKQPPGDHRQAFIEMAKKAGYDSVRLDIPDQFLNTAVLNEEIVSSLPTRFEAFDAAFRLLDDLVKEAKESGSYKEDYLKNAERIAELASVALEKMLK